MRSPGAGAWALLGLVIATGCRPTASAPRPEPKPEVSASAPTPGPSTVPSVAPAPAGSIGATVRMSGPDAFVDAAFPCDTCNPPALRLGAAVGVRAFRLIDLEGEPVAFKNRSEMMGALSIPETASFPALLCSVERGAPGKTYSLLVIVSLRNRQPKVLYASDEGNDVAFVHGKKPVLDLRLVQNPSIPPGFTGMPPKPRTLTYEFDGQLYINVGNDRGGPTNGPSISL